MIRPDQIPKLTPHQRTRPPRMLPDHHLVPRPHLQFGLDEDKLQALNRTGRGGDVYGAGDRFRQAPRLERSGLLPGATWQNEVSFPLQVSQRLQTGGTLHLATGIEEAEPPADVVGQGRPLEGLPTRLEREAYLLQVLELGEGTLDLVLGFHPAKLYGAPRIVQRKLRAKGSPRGRIGCGGDASDAVGASPDLSGRARDRCDRTDFEAKIAHGRLQLGPSTLTGSTGSARVDDPEAVLLWRFSSSVPSCSGGATTLAPAGHEHRWHLFALQETSPMKKLSMVLSVIALVTSATACAEKASPEEVERACRRNLEFPTWESWERTLKTKGFKTADIEAARPQAAKDIAKELETAEAKELRAKCAEVFSKLTKKQIQCRLNAKTHSEFMACPPQPKKK